MAFTSDRIIDLTVDEFREVIRMELSSNQPPVRNTGCTSPKHYVYGLKGICDIFNCSHKTAQYYKDHVISEAVCQNGRKIVVDVELALELFKERRNRRA